MCVCVCLPGWYTPDPIGAKQNQSLGPNYGQQNICTPTPVSVPVRAILTQALVAYIGVLVPTYITPTGREGLIPLKPYEDSHWDHDQYFPLIGVIHIA